MANDLYTKEELDRIDIFNILHEIDLKIYDAQSRVYNMEGIGKTERNAINNKLNEAGKIIAKLTWNAVEDM